MHTRTTTADGNNPNRMADCTDPAPKITLWVWFPAVPSEPAQMLVAWGREFVATWLGTPIKAFLILNGPGAAPAGEALRRDMPAGVEVCCLTDRASIGNAQQFVMHRFLRSDAAILARVDPDGQFSLGSVAEMCRRLTTNGPDVIVAQRDEASVSGRIHFLGNVVLRLVAMRLGLLTDLNSGCYAMNRKAAAALCQLPLPKYPEPRMLAWLKSMSMQVSSMVVPTLPRQSGTSSIKGVWRAVSVFFSSLLELLSCDRI